MAFKRLTLAVFLATGAVALFAFQNCGLKGPGSSRAGQNGDAAGPGGTYTLTGKLQEEKLDGCDLLLYDETGQPYQVVNLPESLKEAGKQLKIEAVPRNDMMSLCMKGPIVEAVRAEEIK